jgi:hypothetical protein
MRHIVGEGVELLLRDGTTTALTYIEGNFRENLTRNIKNFGASGLPCGEWVLALYGFPQA